MIETSGWDTHSAQASRLATQLKALDSLIGGLQAGLGAAWSQTVVLVATEFGRTVAANGTGGTDHGTGAADMLVGGAVLGGLITVDHVEEAHHRIAREAHDRLELERARRGASELDEALSVLQLTPG